jgi:hypothetical protein
MYIENQTGNVKKMGSEGALVWGDVATMSLAVVMGGRRPNIALKRPADRTLGCGVAPRDV